jgi:hypothetical protein
MQFDDETTSPTPQENIGVGLVRRCIDQFVCLPFFVLAAKLLGKTARKNQIERDTL